MILEYSMREGAKAPTRANPSDAGLDVYYCPKDPSISAASIKPGDNMVLPTGLSFGVPHGYMLQVCNRSSMGAKHSLVVGAHIVDSGYDGEIFVNLQNISLSSSKVLPGQKIAQAVLVPILMPSLQEVEEDSVYESPTQRGDGGFGSTGI